MATDDDDILTGPVPAPDADATPSERARAKNFADLVDKTLAGRTPPAMSADDRALITVATSSNARSSALIAGGVRPASVLSTRSAKFFARARSLGVASASGAGTGPVRMSSSSVAIGFSLGAFAELLAERAHGAEQKHVERADRDAQLLRAVFAR